LWDVDINLSAGEVVCVAGEESAGKTALLQCITGLLKCDAGSVRWFGETLLPGMFAPDVNCVSATPVYYPFLTVRDVIELKASRANVLRPLSFSSRELLAMLELDMRLDARIADLSRSELRCVSIAEAVVQNPMAILVDTAPSEMRTLSRAALATLRVFAERGGAVMIAARDPVALSDAATRIVMLHEGTIRRSFYWDSIVPASSLSHPPLLLAETLH
jgi:ABC-type multidrug transport system ATPase subunit